MSSEKHGGRKAKRAKNKRAKCEASERSTKSAIFFYLKALDTPKSLAVWLLFSNNEHDQLLELGCNPMDYTCKYKFRDDYSAACFLSKANFLDTTFDKKKVAMEKFFRFEQQCAVTNHRFRHPHSDEKLTHLNSTLLSMTQRKIESVLGDYSALELLEGCAWGPGVSILVKGKKTSSSHKYHYENGLTSRLYAWCREVNFFHHIHPLWQQRLTQSGKLDFENAFVTHHGNKLDTVPKNSKTDRVIAVEPGMNMFIQKSIGKMMKRRLLRQGIDLSNQGINQERCKNALPGKLATVDFSSASDSISKAVVEALLPPRWLALTDLTRSPSYYISTDSNIPLVEQIAPWNKYSSMGNGFTFELESLIFFAAACSVMTHLGLQGRPSVYGDDVIIPAAAYELFTSFCDFLGFTVNLEKSFSSGLFYESCGHHYFDGLDVQPIFLKERLTNDQSFFKLANSIRVLAHRRNSYYGCDSRFRLVNQYLRRRVSTNRRFVVPASNPSAGFVGNFDEARPKRTRGWDGYRYSGIRTKAVAYNCEDEGHYVANIIGLRSGRINYLGANRNNIGSLNNRLFVERCVAIMAKRDIDELESPIGNDVPLRDVVTFGVYHKFHCDTWYNFGPWM